MRLSGKAIHFVQETKYLVVILNSQVKTLVDVSRQTRKFYAQANMLLGNFRYCSDDVKCILGQHDSRSARSHIALTCTFTAVLHVYGSHLVA